MMKTIKLAIVAVATMISVVTLAALKPGEWNTNFSDSLAYAEKNGVPIVVVWGNTKCSHCAELHAVLEDDQIMDWAKEHPIMMVSKYENVSSKNEDYIAAKQWIQSIEPKITEYPLVGVYWKKTDGTVACNKSFVGRAGRMPATTPKSNLAGQFANSLDLLVGDYPPAPTGSASFVTADTVYDRLEAVSDTRIVNVPLKRNSGDKLETNFLKVEGPGIWQATSFTWQIGETNTMVAVAITKFQAGEQIALTLTDADGIVMATSSITMVEEPENSTTNPCWIGESFDVGEWTMDLSAAKAKTASAYGDAYTFVFFTGALWCPWCQGLDAGVLSTTGFKAWTRMNQINLVELDNPRRPTDVTGPTGAPPTLLRYAAGLNNVIGQSVSGASYLSRKTIPTAEAEAVLLRNHRLGYDGPDQGGYCAPEAARSGYPTIVLLRKDGSVAGRFNDYAPTTTGYDTAENMARLRDFLYLVDEGEYLASWRTTTSRTLNVDEPQTAPFQINDTTEWFKLVGPFDKYITVDCVADRDVLLAITDADGKTLGQAAKNSVTIARPTTDVLYLKASCYEDADSTMYASAVDTTRFAAVFALSTSDEAPERVVPFKSLTKAEQKLLNPELYAKQSATVPVYASVALGGKRLVGTLTVGVTSANKISAKFIGDTTVSFSGTWDEISLSSGAVSTVLEKKVSKMYYGLNLTMNAEGAFDAEVLADDETLGSGSSAAGDISSYAGNYTVTMVNEKGETGTGSLTVKVTIAGKATVRGILPDGTSISLSATLSPNEDGTATLPIYKSSTKYMVSTALAISPNAYETWGDKEAAKWTVKSVPTCNAIWESDEVYLYTIYGSYWESTTPLAICEYYDLSDVLSVVIGGETNDVVVATKNGFKVSKDVVTSLSFTKSTGAFTGKAKVPNGSGKYVNATIKGVLLPGWIDCGCTTEPVKERPYGSGTLYYKSGRDVITLPLDLDANKE